MFDLLNSVLVAEEEELTSTEIKVLTEFLMLPREKFSYQRFSSAAKKRVIKSLNELEGWKLSPENLNNKIYSMIEKKFLRRDTDQVIYLAKHIKLLAYKILDAFEANESFFIAVELVPEKDLDGKKDNSNLETDHPAGTVLQSSGNVDESKAEHREESSRTSI
jgi:hypothetical protein